MLTPTAHLASVAFFFFRKNERVDFLAIIISVLEFLVILFKSPERAGLRLAAQTLPYQICVNFVIDKQYTFANDCVG